MKQHKNIESKNKINLQKVSIIILLLVVSNFKLAIAHHVLGRPAYSLNEDSNTPPSMQVETQMGDYYITYMVFPAFPKPLQAGRVNLYAERINDGEGYKGQVTFKIKNDSWMNSEYETLGVQAPDDGVFRQGFIFSEKGDYIVTAEFEAEGEPYIIDFPLQIGKPFPIGPLGITVGILVLVLASVNLIKKKRLLSAKIQNARKEMQS